MNVMKMTICLAFEDVQCGTQWDAAKADAVHEFILDKLDAEVVMVRVDSSKHVEYPDFTDSDGEGTPPIDEPDPIDLWQARAMSTMKELEWL